MRDFWVVWLSLALLSEMCWCDKSAVPSSRGVTSGDVVSAPVMTPAEVVVHQLDEACLKLRLYGCSEVFLCSAEDCERHVNLWASEGDVHMPAGWCADKMSGFETRDLDCVSRASSPEDVEDCGVACSYDCISPPCASISSRVLR